VSSIANFIQLLGVKCFQSRFKRSVVAIVTNKRFCHVSNGWCMHFRDRENLSLMTTEGYTQSYGDSFGVVKPPSFETVDYLAEDTGGGGPGKIKIHSKIE
jgi:hypothetical protein